MKVNGSHSPPILPERLLFIGDSITDAFRKPEEANESFRLGNGYVFLLAAEWGAGFPATLPRILNRGHSGFCSRDLLEVWEADCLEESPDFTVLLVGINDFLRHRRSGGEKSFSPEALGENVERMGRRWLEAGKSAENLLILEPFLLEAGEWNSDDSRDFARWREEVRRAAGSLGAGLLDLQGEMDRFSGVIPAEWLSYDGIHPGPAGACLIKNLLWHRFVGWGWPECSREAATPNGRATSPVR